MMKSITREKVFHVLKLVLLSLLGRWLMRLDWSMIRSMQTTCIQSIRFPTISLISMWTIAGLGYRGTGGRHWKIGAVRALLYHKFCLDNQPVS